MSQEIKGLRAAAPIAGISYHYAKTLSSHQEFVPRVGVDGQLHVFELADIQAWRRLRERRRS